MTECAFCFAISSDGEPTSHYRISGTGGVTNKRWLCQMCADELRSLGLGVTEA